MNLLGKNTHIIKENTEGLLATSKVDGLEINSDRIKHTFSFLISNFGHVSNVVFFWVIPRCPNIVSMFRNTVSVPSS